MNAPAEATAIAPESRAGRVTPIPAAARNPRAGAHPPIALEFHGYDRRDHPLVLGAYRVFEFTFALVALVLSLPIMLIEAAIIRWDSPGPILFLQTRCGRSRVMRGSELVGRTDIMPPSGGAFDPDKQYWVPTTFRFVKFRTMYHDAKARHPHLYKYDFESHEAFRAAYYKQDDDPRVTPAGRWLRRLTVDELPNLWSVLIGNVALVGPRPEGPFYLPYYSAEEMAKFTVRPGITGLAVIHGRGDLPIGGQIDWDLKYVREHSAWQDIKTIFITAWLVVSRRGAF
jgi:lipopolysaccharide/colanic/teichoic acid biosynthesis glycosyltransferase